MSHSADSIDSPGTQLTVERAAASFPVRELTYFLDGGPEKVSATARCIVLALHMHARVGTDTSPYRTYPVQPITTLASSLTRRAPSPAQAVTTTLPYLARN